MAKLVFNDAFFSFNGVDLSDHVKQIELVVEMNEVDITAMGNGGYASHLAGMKKWTATATLFNDYAAATVDITVFPQLGNAVPIIIRPVKSTVVGPTNPNFTGTAAVISHTPISGAVGEAALTVIKLSGQDALLRATS